MKCLPAQLRLASYASRATRICAGHLLSNVMHLAATNVLGCNPCIAHLLLQAPLRPAKDGEVRKAHSASRRAVQHQVFHLPRLPGLLQHTLVT